MQMYIHVYKTWMEGTYDIPNKNPNFCDFLTKSDGVFAKMQLFSYIFSYCRPFSCVVRRP